MKRRINSAALIPVRFDALVSLLICIGVNQIVVRFMMLEVCYYAIPVSSVYFGALITSTKYIGRGVPPSCQSSFARFSLTNTSTVFGAPLPPAQVKLDSVRDSFTPNSLSASTRTIENPSSRPSLVILNEHASDTLISMWYRHADQRALTAASRFSIIWRRAFCSCSWQFSCSLANSSCGYCPTIGAGRHGDMSPDSARRRNDKPAEKMRIERMNYRFASGHRCSGGGSGSLPRHTFREMPAFRRRWTIRCSLGASALHPNTKSLAPHLRFSVCCVTGKCGCGGCTPSGGVRVRKFRAK